MNQWILSLVACILALLAAVHLLWGLGLPWGQEASIPWARTGETFSKPGPSANLAVSFALMLAAAGVLMPYDPWLKTQSLRLMALVLALRAFGDFRYSGFSKRIHGSRFAAWDTYLYSPACACIAALTLLSTVL